MNIPDILRSTEHRPWELPTGSWKFYQEWNKVLFLHWQVDSTEVKALLPKGLEIDCYKGKAWVSLVAFNMEKAHPKLFPVFRPISYFYEVNFRTYVRYGNKSGVYFLSIEGGNKWSCKMAKALSELPYRYSKMERTETSFSSFNSEREENLELYFRLGEEYKRKSNLDCWLSERYALFQDTRKAMNEFEIHHQEWLLFELELTELTLNYPRFGQLLKGTPDKAHYSPGVQVLAWGKKKNYLL
jgi:uncharacterized protein YqjF (DUF2071 family)